MFTNCAVDSCHRCGKTPLPALRKHGPRKLSGYLPVRRQAVVAPLFSSICLVASHSFLLLALRLLPISQKCGYYHACDERW